MGIGPSIVVQYKDLNSLSRAFEEVMEEPDTDAIIVSGPASDFSDVVSVFAEVESRGLYDRVHDGRRVGLIRVFQEIGHGYDQRYMLELLSDQRLLRQASSWLVHPVLFHPNMRFGDENGLLGNTQQFVDGFERRFGMKPSILTAMAANSCLNLRQAIEIAAVDSPGTVPSSAEILAGLANISAETVRVLFPSIPPLPCASSLMASNFVNSLAPTHGSSWGTTSMPTCRTTS